MISELTRADQAHLINDVANKPDVFSQFTLALPDNSAIDLTTCIVRADYRVLTNGKDAFMLADAVSPVLFHCHSLFDTTCRGRDAVREGKALVQWMWDNTPAEVLYGATPVSNRPARMFNRWIGAVSDGQTLFAAQGATYLAEWFRIMRPR